MKLRSLKQNDAIRMLEWMHDETVVEKLQTDFSSKTLDDCRDFIANSRSDNNLNLAIENDDGLYMGTVSLKHIHDGIAEFAIALHREAIGKGIAILAMREMLSIGFKRYDLKMIFWCVAEDNIRAIKFYDKNGFERFVPKDTKGINGYTNQQINAYIWYQINAEE